MKVDLSVVLSVVAITVTLFGVTAAYLATLRLKGTVYDEEHQRVELDRTRAALEADFRRMYEEIYRDRSRWDELNHLVLDMAKSAKFHSRDEQARSAVDQGRFLTSFGLAPNGTQVSPSQVFVLTPLSDQEVPIYNVVQAACKKAGLNAIRGDEQNISGAILPVIIQEIVRSRFVIANLNGRNPNVFYEMGIAQALGKDVLMFAHRDGVSELPFDIAHQQILFYETQKQLHDRLVQAIAQLGWGSERTIRAG